MPNECLIEFEIWDRNTACVRACVHECLCGLVRLYTHRCWPTAAHFIDFIDAEALAADAADRNRMMVAAGSGRRRRCRCRRRRHQTHRCQGGRSLCRAVQLWMLEMMLLLILAGDAAAAAGWRWCNHSFHTRPSLMLVVWVMANRMSGCG